MGTYSHSDLHIVAPVGSLGRVKLTSFRLFCRTRGFEGGVVLPVRRDRTTGMPVQPFPQPSIVNVPLQQQDGPPAIACVEFGQQIAAGERIGRAKTADAADVHSPFAGRVIAIGRVNSARKADLPAVRIETSPPTAPEPPTPLQLPPDMPPPALDELGQAARTAGLTDFQRRGGSLAHLLQQAGSRNIRHLLINTLPAEPLMTGDAVQIEDNLDTIARMAALLGRAIGARRTTIAVDACDRRLLASLRKLSHGTRVRVFPVLNKYPQHMPVLLAASLTKLETPPGASTLAVGVLVLEALSLVALAEALQWPEHPPRPLTHRVVTVTGPAVIRAGHYRIPIGTSFANVLMQVGLRSTVKRIVEGGLITGRAIGDLNCVITKQTSTILVLDRAADRVPTPGPCVRCGWCQEDCPVGLDPHMLLDLAERGEAAAAARLHPQACVECGLCSYVCPAELPLAAAVSQLKRRITMTV